MREPHILFVHGTFGQASDWKAVREHLHKLIDCSSSALDLPGHAGRPLGVGQNAFEQLVHAVRDEIKQPSIVVGYSLGGRVALHAMLCHDVELPVQGLILEGANPGIEDLSARSERAHLDAQRATEIARIGLTAFLDKWYQMPLFGFADHDDDARAKLVNKRAAHKDPAAIAQIVRDASPGRVPSLWTALSTLSVPLAFVHGAKDQRYADIGERLRLTCPDAQVHSIADAGHNAHNDHPEAFAQFVATFVQQLVRPSA